MVLLLEDPDDQEDAMHINPLMIGQVLQLLQGVGHRTPDGQAAEALKVAGSGRDDEQDATIEQLRARVAGLEIRVATLERALRLMLESRR